jgi:multidrug efflux pump subunit AcrA (membrane-fusion protein)
MPENDNKKQLSEKRKLHDLIPDLTENVDEIAPNLIQESKKTKKSPIPLAKKIIFFGFIAVALGTLANLEFEPVIKGTAEIIPSSTTVINAKEEGVLKHLYCKHGQSVHKGQLVGELENTKIDTELNTVSKNLRSSQNNLLHIEENEVNLEKELERKKALYESGAISLRDLEEAELKHRRLILEKQITMNQIAIYQSEIEEYKTRQERLKFYSPTEGVITTKIDELLGTYISKGDQICVIADMIPLMLQLPLAEKRLPLIKIGQEAEIIYTVDPSVIYSGQVTKVNPQLWTMQENPRIKKNVVSVIIEPEEVPPFPIRLGMTAKAKIFTKKKSLFDIIFERML